MIPVNRQGRPSTRGRDVGSPLGHPDPRLRLAVEIRRKREEMKAWGFSQADIRDEVERMRSTRQEAWPW